jgi:hypothetical protein
MIYVSQNNIREASEEFIKLGTKLLDVKKPVKLSIQPKHPSAMASVRKLKDGLEVDDASEDYDEIELFIYENTEIRNQFHPSVSSVALLSEIIHELLHIKHPDWSEDSIANEDARITGIIVKHMKKGNSERMTYNIKRNTITKTQTDSYPTGDRPEETYVRAREEVSVYGTEDVLAYLTKLLEHHNVSFSRLKTCVKFKTSTEKYEDIEKHLQQKFRAASQQKTETSPTYT